MLRIAAARKQFRLQHGIEAVLVFQGLFTTEVEVQVHAALFLHDIALVRQFLCVVPNDCFLMAV